MVKDVFFTEECFVKYSFYESGRVKLALHSKRTGMQIINCTLNFKSKIDNRFLFIKDYDTNQGVYEALLKSGIIFPFKGRVDVGFKEALVCEFNACRVCDEDDFIERVCKTCKTKILVDNGKTT